MFATPLAADPEPAEAAGASLLVPGLGQALNHQEGKGLLMFGGSLYLLALGIAEEIIHIFGGDEEGKNHSDLLTGGGYGVWAWSVYDAYSVARKRQRKQEAGKSPRAFRSLAPPEPRLRVGLGWVREDTPGVMVQMSF